MGIFIYDNFTFDILIRSSVILSLLAVIAIQFTYFPVPVKVEKQSFRFLNMIFEKEVWFQALLAVITTFSFGAIMNFLVLFGKQKGLEHIFLFFLINAIVSTLIRPFTGKWYDKRGPWSIIIKSALIGFLSLIILSYATNDLHFIIAGILFGAGYSTIMLSLQTWAVQKVSKEKTGAANATFFSSFDIGVGMSTFVLGIFTKWYNLDTIFQIVSISFIIVAFLVYKDYLYEKSNGDKIKANLLYLKGHQLF